ncbi:hypothetical protein VTO73DRAFT_12792 [Trametes versicolor]
MASTSTSSLFGPLGTAVHVLRRVPYFLYTLLLFTKSDLKTTVGPVSSLAIASAPVAGPLRVPHVVFWVWLHVLQFDLANQCMDPEEDAQNKRERPLPAKRIALAQARFLRWAIVPVCLRFSALYSAETVYASFALAFLTLLYNELTAHRRHWAIRNLVNAIGFASFEVGATLVAGANPTRLDGIALCSVLASTGIFATTIHTQDFKDVDGDRAIGRQTIPIVFGTAARWTVIVPLVLWSVGLSVLWGLGVVAGTAVTALAAHVGILYLRAQTINEYQVAFYWYNSPLDQWAQVLNFPASYYFVRKLLLSALTVTPWPTDLDVERRMVTASESGAFIGMELAERLNYVNAVIMFWVPSEREDFSLTDRSIPSDLERGPKRFLAQRHDSRCIDDLSGTKMPVRPTPQGVNHPTFKAAQFKHGLSLPGLYEYHAKHSPNHAVFTYADPETREPHNISYAEAWEKISAIARIVERNYQQSSTKKPVSKDSRPVIGILAISDALSYVFLEVAIMSLGYTAFPMSPRNLPVVIAHLLEKTGGLQLYVSEDAATQSFARDAAKLLEQKGIHVDLLSMIKPDEWLSLPAGVEPFPIVAVADTDLAVILHSSGTTAFPKPIPITRRGLVNLSNIPCYGEVDLAGKRIAAHTNPICHAMGLATMLWPLSSGCTFALYPPEYPPRIPTPADFLTEWVACKSNIVFCIPAFIEAWAQNARNLPTLQALDCIVFSGAPINKAIGDNLAKAGVTLHPFWGSTEVGPATMFIPRDPPPIDEWEYFKFSHHITFKLEPREGLQGIVEPIMIPTDVCFPQVTNAERDGQRVFAVGDLLEPHPTDKNRWKVFGRVDDQIALSTGEKINPVPFEGTVAHDPLIASVLVFGNMRIDPGLLVEPAAGNSVPPGDAQKLQEYKDLIWPVIEKANAQVPELTRIKRNMIVVTSAEKPLEHTPKGTARRGVCLKLYEAEIDALYAAAADADAELRAFPDRAHG